MRLFKITKTMQYHDVYFIEAPSKASAEDVPVGASPFQSDKPACVGVKAIDITEADFQSYLAKMEAK